MGIQLVVNDLKSGGMSPKEYRVKYPAQAKGLPAIHILLDQAIFMVYPYSFQMIDGYIEDQAELSDPQLPEFIMKQAQLFPFLSDVEVNIDSG